MQSISSSKQFIRKEISVFAFHLKMQKSPCKTLYRWKHKMPHNNTEKDHRVTKGRRDGTGGSPRRWGCRARAPDSYGHPISVPSNPKFTGLMEIVMETFYCQAWYAFGWKGCAQEIRGELWVTKRPHDTIKTVLACICETDKDNGLHDPDWVIINSTFKALFSDFPLKKLSPIWRKYPLNKGQVRYGPELHYKNFVPAAVVVLNIKFGWFRTHSFSKI